jgi:hypothetical protein
MPTTARPESPQHREPLAGRPQPGDQSPQPPIGRIAGGAATDLNGRPGTQTVEERAEIIVRLAGLDPDGPSGGYFDRAGRVPW